jgi:hypothetical protein
VFIDTRDAAVWRVKQSHSSALGFRHPSADTQLATLMVELAGPRIQQRQQHGTTPLY